MTVDDEAPDEADLGLADAQERLRAFQDCIPHLAWTARVDGSIDYCNRRWLEYTGLGLDQLDGWKWVDVVHPDDRGKFLERWRHAMATSEHFEEEVRLRRHDGVYRWHMMRDWPARSEHRGIAGWFGTGTDTEEQRQWADRIRQANRELDQFAAVAAHDLQEPVRMVTGFLKLLQRHAGAKHDDVERGYVQQAIDGAGRLERLIKDLLAFARAGRDTLSPTLIDTEQALAEAVANLGPQIAEQGATVRHGVLPRVAADRVQIVRLLQNLISNAIKFARAGTPAVVTVSATVDDDGVTFSIADNGIGMRPEDQTRIFGAFERVHSGAEYPGTGLGLSICQRIVERHGGRIWVESAVGAGSTFRFMLPQR